MQQHYIQQLDSLKKPYKIYADYVENLAAEQFINCMQHPAIIQGALMPDTHAGYAAPRIYKKIKM